jgi:hypothetical protein
LFFGLACAFPIGGDRGEWTTPEPRGSGPGAPTRGGEYFGGGPLRGCRPLGCMPFGALSGPPRDVSMCVAPIGWRPPPPPVPLFTGNEPPHARRLPLNRPERQNAPKTLRDNLFVVRGPGDVIPAPPPTDTLSAIVRRCHVRPSAGNLARPPHVPSLPSPVGTRRLRGPSRRRPDAPHVCAASPTDRGPTRTRQRRGAACHVELSQLSPIFEGRIGLGQPRLRVCVVRERIPKQVTVKPEHIRTAKNKKPLAQEPTACDDFCQRNESDSFLSWKSLRRKKKKSGFPVGRERHKSHPIPINR